LTDAFLSDLAELISIESVKGPPETGAPFGIGPVRALSFYLNKASDFGFEVSDIDGYSGEVVWDPGASGGPGVAAIAHLDVVPAGEGWSVPPFRLTRKEGMLMGRGVFDDKGPALGLLYALAGLRERGFRPGRRIRLIMGTNEESGMAGLGEYLLRRGEPLYSFTPDALFPVVRGEKGILDAAFHWPIETGSSRETGIPCIRPLILETGPASTSRTVPAACRLLLAGPGGLLEEVRTLLSGERDGSFRIALSRPGHLDLRFLGLSAPSSAPWLGINAMIRSFCFLARCGEKIPVEPPFDLISRFVCERMNERFRGEGFALGDLRDESGGVSINPGAGRIAGGRFSLELELRYPVSIPPGEVEEALRNTALSYGGGYERLRGSEPLLLGEGHPLVSALLAVYREVSGDVSAKPVITGGETYARVMGNCLGFGPLFPGSALTAHKPDEYILEEDLLSGIAIWSGALARMSML
jgi:succinyl-diaminopimelate desuccinylase